MMNWTYSLFLLYLISAISLAYGTPEEDLPIAYQGRFRPLWSYARQQSTTPEELWKQNFHGVNSDQELYRARFKLLKLEKRPPKEIAQKLEWEFPLSARLHAAGDFTVIPGKSAEWFSPQVLATQVYSPMGDRLVPIGNFTAFEDEVFDQLQDLYQKNDLQAFIQTLYDAYGSIEGTAYQKAHHKQLSYPSFQQLKAENLYVRYPWIDFLIFFYGFSLLLYLVGLNRTATALLIFAFFMHTFVLLLRCYILNRPPVSNMYETALYVPWIAVAVGFILNKMSGYRASLMAAALGALLILGIVRFSGMDDTLSNVQAVLDSQFWLIIHVLMVVGSYGFFLLAAILGHIYLLGSFFSSKAEEWMSKFAHLILQSLYAGTGLLIGGTILGGVWAAESWGRFWDWDPKEAWAFISSCLYLLFIHAYRFRKIGEFGLAMGAIIGFLAISFTWYGVNYILGTGLHSYGFGSGGELYYYLFTAIEFLFIVTGLIFHLNLEKNRAKQIK